MLCSGALCSEVTARRRQLCRVSLPDHTFGTARELTEVSEMAAARRPPSFGAEVGLPGTQPQIGRFFDLPLATGYISHPE
jgi:hypothetical protein